METKKKALLIFSFILAFAFLIYISPVQSILIQVFNNSLQTENLTFTGSQNITRYLDIYFNASVSSAFINITGNSITSSVFWNVTQTSASDKNFSLNSQATSPKGFFFNDSGTGLFVADQDTDNIYQYELSTPWDITTAAFTNNISISEDTLVADVFINNSGTGMYISTRGDEELIFQYSLSTPWNVSTATYSNKNLTPVFANPFGIFFNNSGTGMFIVTQTGNTISQYELSTPWDISTGVNNHNFNLASETMASTGVFINSSGTGMFIMADEVFGAANVRQYELSTPWVVSSASFTNNIFNVKTVAENAPTYWDVFFNNTGDKYYSIGDTGDFIFQFDLSSSVFPSSPYLEIGTPDGAFEWNISGTLDHKNQTPDLRSSINSNITACSRIAENCSIAFLFSSTDGILEYEDIAITWTEGIKPNVTINSITQVGTTNSFTFNATSVDDFLDSCFYSIFQSSTQIRGNTTYTCNSITTVALSADGTYTLFVYANDTTNNLNQTSQQFTLVASESQTGGQGAEEPPPQQQEEPIVQFSPDDTVVENPPDIPADRDGGSAEGLQPLIIIGANVSWSIETIRGGGAYQLEMAQGEDRTKELLFRNLGNTTVNLMLVCENLAGNLCSFVDLKDQFIDLPVTESPTLSEFEITLPDNIEIGEQKFRIVAVDQENNGALLNVIVNIGFLGNIVDIVSELFSLKGLLISAGALVFGIILFFTVFRRFSLGIPVVLILMISGIIISLILF